MMGHRMQQQVRRRPDIATTRARRRIADCKILQEQPEILVALYERTTDCPGRRRQLAQDAVSLQECSHKGRFKLNVDSLVLLLDNIDRAFVAWQRWKSHKADGHAPVFLDGFRR